MKYVWSVVKIPYYLFLTFTCFLFCLSLFTLIGGGITNGFVLDEETKGNISMLGVSFVLMIIGFFIHRESMLNVWDFFFSFGRFGVPLFLVCIIILIIISFWMLVKDVNTFDERGGQIAFGVLFLGLFILLMPIYSVFYRWFKKVKEELLKPKEKPKGNGYQKPKRKKRKKRRRR